MEIDVIIGKNNPISRREHCLALGTAQGVNAANTPGSTLAKGLAMVRDGELLNFVVMLSSKC